MFMLVLCKWEQIMVQLQSNLNWGHLQYIDTWLWKLEHTIILQWAYPSELNMHINKIYVKILEKGPTFQPHYCNYIYTICRPLKEFRCKGHSIDTSTSILGVFILKQNIISNLSQIFTCICDTVLYLKKERLSKNTQRECCIETLNEAWIRKARISYW